MPALRDEQDFLNNKFCACSTLLGYWFGFHAPSIVDYAVTTIDVPHVPLTMQRGCDVDQARNLAKSATVE